MMERVQRLAYNHVSIGNNVELLLHPKAQRPLSMTNTGIQSLRETLLTEQPPCI